MDRLKTISFGICLLALSADLQSQDPIDRRKPSATALSVVKPYIAPAETITPPLDVVGLAVEEYTPNFFPKNKIAKAQNEDLVFHHDVGMFEFAYKPLRLGEFDLPQADGKMKRVTVAYLVYRIRNLGDHASYKLVKNEAGQDQFQLTSSDQINATSFDNHFLANFSLEGWVQDFNTGKYKKIRYFDEIQPELLNQIDAEEHPPKKLLNSAEMIATQIPVNKNPDDVGTWGVAIWPSIDPRMNYYSVYIRGLTNAFRVHQDPKGELSYQYKTLQLNFWRPGDEFATTRDEIQNGVPLTGVNLDQSIICRFYDLPGPSITARRVYAETTSKTTLFELDTPVDKELNALAVLDLKAGKIPSYVVESFASLGLTIPEGTPVEEKIDSALYQFTIDVDGVSHVYELAVEPKFWRKTRNKVEIIKQVDNFWLFR